MVLPPPLRHGVSATTKASSDVSQSLSVVAHGFLDAGLEAQYLDHEWSRQQPYMRWAAAVCLLPLCVLHVAGALGRADNLTAAVLSRCVLGTACGQRRGALL